MWFSIAQISTGLFFSEFLYDPFWRQLTTKIAKKWHCLWIFPILINLTHIYIYTLCFATKSAQTHVFWHNSRLFPRLLFPNLNYKNYSKILFCRISHNFSGNVLTPRKCHLALLATVWRYCRSVEAQVRYIKVQPYTSLYLTMDFSRVGFM